MIFELTFDILRVMRTYNEPIGRAQLDRLGRPVAWTWRGRRYVGVGRELEYWVETTAWWRQLEAIAAPDGQVEHWVMRTIGDDGQVELAHDQAAAVWRIVGVID